MLRCLLKSKGKSNEEIHNFVILDYMISLSLKNILHFVKMYMFCRIQIL